MPDHPTPTLPTVAASPGSDRQEELVLLENFVPAGGSRFSRDQLIAYWRAGKVDALAHADELNASDLPSFQKRSLADRNRNWLPKIEDFLQHHRSYFVVVGVGHFGGPNGVLALLRARGYQIEQL